METTASGIDTVWNRPADHSSRLAEASNVWVPIPNRWGGWYGRAAGPGTTVLALVGEVLNAKRVDEAWPALYGGVTGLFLWRALATARITPHKCYFTNANKSTKLYTVDLKSELEGEVLPEKTIALGKVASRALWLAGVSHYALPHPAYWKRFHTDEFATYAALLKEIAF